MKKFLQTFCAFLSAAVIFSCAENAIEPTIAADETSSPQTRVGNGKKVMIYVETNDVNPLNALTYVKTSDGTPFIDILNLFAANIHKDSGGNPSLYFNKELAPIMADVDTYIRPLQEAGIKVLLSLLPNWQGVGFSNLTDPAEFAELVAYVVYTYGMDGITINDHYAGYSSYLSSGTCGAFISALRAEFDARGGDKVISLYQWSNYGSGHITSTQGAMLDNVDHGAYGYNSFASCGVAGTVNTKFMPVAINIGQTYSSIYSMSIRRRMTQVITGDYAGVMGFNMRGGSDVNAAGLFNLWAQGFAGVTSGSYVTWNGTFYPEGPELPGGHTITNYDVPTNF